MADFISDELRDMAELASVPFELEGIPGDNSIMVSWGSMTAEGESLDVALIRLAILVLDHKSFQIRFLQGLKARMTMDDWDDLFSSQAAVEPSPRVVGKLGRSRWDLA